MDKGKFVAKPVVVIPRSEWDPDPLPGTLEPTVQPVKHVVFTFDTDMDVCKSREECIAAMRVLKERHIKTEEAVDIKYNFLVGGDGDVYEGRGFDWQPCKSLGLPEYRGDRLDLAFIGRYSGMEALTPKQQISALDVINGGVKKNIVDEWYYYYEIKPGDAPTEPEPTKGYASEEPVISAY